MLSAHLFKASQNLPSTFYGESIGKLNHLDSNLKFTLHPPNPSSTGEACMREPGVPQSLR